ncbi:MAG: hypothetical protein NT135_01900 [Candidatus Berkelbacteria bacterium]|nr:hypothetical protein [Candidatus Berkelbacteria bacterium]
MKSRWLFVVLFVFILSFGIKACGCSGNLAKIAFVDTLRGHLMVENENETGYKDLVESPNCESPVWSPDGKWIAYLSWEKAGNWRKYKMFIVSDDGSKKRMIVEYAYNIDQPCWSPDSSKLIFVWQQKQNSPDFVYLYNLSSSRLELLSKASESFSAPHFLDSNQVIYADDVKSQAIIYNTKTKEIKHVQIPDASWFDYWVGDIAIIDNCLVFQVVGESGTYKLSFVALGSKKPTWFIDRYNRLRNTMLKEAVNVEKIVVAKDGKSVYLLVNNSEEVDLGHSKTARDRIIKIEQTKEQVIFKQSSNWLVTDFEVLDNGRILLEFMKIAQGYDDNEHTLRIYDTHSNRSTIIAGSAKEPEVWQGNQNGK